jgi:hypothetical protein
MSDGIDPESLLTVAFTIPLSSVHDRPLSVIVTGAFVFWAHASDGIAASTTAASHKGQFERIIFMGVLHKRYVPAPPKDAPSLLAAM